MYFGANALFREKTAPAGQRPNWRAICQSQVSAKIVKSEAYQAKSGSSGCLTYTDVKRAKISSYLTSTTERLCYIYRTYSFHAISYRYNILNSFKIIAM